MMQIRLVPYDQDGHPDENARIWLAGAPDKTEREHTSAIEERRGHPRAQEVITGSDWERRDFIDRGNEGVELSFSTSRLFGSALAAWRWRNLWSRQKPADWPHPIQGDVVLRHLLPDGSFEEEVIRQCLLAKPLMLPQGATMQLSYNLQGRWSEDYRTGEFALVMTSAPTAAMITTDMLFVGDGSTYQVDLQTGAAPGTTWQFEVDTNASLVNPGYTAISASAPATDMAAALVADGVDAVALSPLILRIRTAGVEPAESVSFTGVGKPGDELFNYTANNGTEFPETFVHDSLGRFVFQEILN